MCGSTTVTGYHWVTHHTYTWNTSHHRYDEHKSYEKVAISRAATQDELNATGPCGTQPPSYTEDSTVWNSLVCGSTTVTGTKTTHYFEYVWDYTSQQYVAQETGSPLVESVSRAATQDELNATGPCGTPPPDYTEDPIVWNDLVCGQTTVTGTQTTHYFHYVWDYTSQQYVAEEYGTPLVESVSRAATQDELDATGPCGNPGDDYTESSTVWDDLKCGSTTVTGTKTTHYFTYVWDYTSQQYVAEETGSPLVESVTRDATQDELNASGPCGEPGDDYTESSTVWGSPTCESSIVEGTKTTHYFTYEWDNSSQSYVPVETGTPLVESVTRAATAEELANLVCETPPVDVCPNLQGDQSSVPDGMVVVDGDCVTEVTEGVVDACKNIDGDQETVPAGYTLVDGDCVKDSTPTLTEVTLAATGANGTSLGAAGALALILGGLGLTLLRRRVASE